MLKKISDDIFIAGRPNWVKTSTVELNNSGDIITIRIDDEDQPDL